MGGRRRWLARAQQILLGSDPRALVPFLIPTALAFALDVVLRARDLASWAPQGKGIYLSSLAISAALWTLPLWGAARLLAAARGGARLARGAAWVAFALLFLLWITPLAVFGFGGQVLFRRVMHAYMGRDTVRLGLALHGTVTDWFAACGSPLVLVATMASGLVLASALFVVVRRAAPRLAGAGVPWLPVVTFVAAVVCVGFDLVDSRFLQAATPDDCFVHGVVRAACVRVTNDPRSHRGFTLRTPAPLPPLTPKRPQPNIVLVLTESVRADAICSDPPPTCTARFLDEVASDRIALGKLTTVSPGTFSACMVLWTGLPITADAHAAHSAPVLWELAKAAGYRTGYITSQNFLFENFGIFVQNAGIDVTESATDLGGLAQEQLGAPDERATAEALRFIRDAKGRGPSPYFVVVHLSNTHTPYRVDPDLQPFTPHSTAVLGDVTPLRNHYQNSVLLQERTVSAFLRDLRSLPGWDDTAVVFLSDHGEQFRERGGLYHIHSLYDEEVRVPGFLLAGAHVLRPDQRAALLSYAGKRTFTEDVNATIVDLMGLGGERVRLPYVNPAARSLVAPPGWTSDPLVPMATSSAVWEADDVRVGAMQGEHLITGSPHNAFTCYDIAHDQAEVHGLPPAKCGILMNELAQKL